MKYTTVADCCKILDSQRVPVTASDRKSGPYPYYGANGVQDYVDDFIFDDELVLVAEDGGHFGSKEHPIAYRVSGKCWVNNHAHVLKPLDYMDADYVCYSLMHYPVMTLIKGATRQKLNQADLRKMKIIIRPLHEQKKIASIIKRTERSIQLYQAIAEQLDVLVKSRFVEMFGDLETNPKGWKKTTFDEVSVKITDGEHATVPRVADGHVFLNARNVLKTGKIDLTGVTFISDDNHNRIYKRCNPEPGDILLTTTGTIGNVAIVPEMDAFSMDRGITLIKQDRTVMNSIFFAVAMQMDSLQMHMRNGIHASAIGHLFMNKVKALPVFVPPINLQNQFADFVALTDKSKFAVQQSIDTLQTLKAKLMQDYFG